MKFLIILFSGLFIGLWASWSDILISNKWKCFSDISCKSAKVQISLKTALALSENYLVKGNNNIKISKLGLLAILLFDSQFHTKNFL